MLYVYTRGAYGTAGVPPVCRRKTAGDEYARGMRAFSPFVRPFVFTPTCFTDAFSFFFLLFSFANPKPFPPFTDQNAPTSVHGSGRRVGRTGDYSQAWLFGREETRMRMDIERARGMKFRPFIWRHQRKAENARSYSSA